MVSVAGAVGNRATVKDGPYQLAGNSGGLGIDRSRMRGEA